MRAAEPTQITVTGTGSVSLPPDQAVVNASIQTHNTTNAGAALGENEAAYEHVVAAVTTLGIPRADITLSFYNVNYMAPPPNRTDYAYGFTVDRNFAIKVRRVAMAGQVVDAAIGGGATTISGISFGLQDPAAASNEAMQRAVTDATARAQSLAHDAGLRIVDVASVALGNVYSPSPPYRALQLNAEVASPLPPTTFDNGSASVVVTVTIVFLAKP